MGCSICTVNVDFGNIGEIVNEFENLICRWAPASAFSPFFNHSFVVSVHSEVYVPMFLNKCMNEEVEANCLSPTDVASFTFSARYESPASPLVPNYNSNPNFRASI